MGGPPLRLDVRMNDVVLVEGGARQPKHQREVTQVAHAHVLAHADRLVVSFGQPFGSAQQTLEVPVEDERIVDAALGKGPPHLEREVVADAADRLIEHQLFRVPLVRQATDELMEDVNAHGESATCGAHHQHLQRSVARPSHARRSPDSTAVAHRSSHEAATACRGRR